jgi:hypothetical protein
MKNTEKKYYLFAIIIIFLIVNLFSFFKINNLVGVSMYDYKKYSKIKYSFVKNNKGVLPHPFLGSTSTKSIPIDSIVSDEPIFHSISKKPSSKREIKVLILGGSVASHLSKGGIEVENEIFARTLNDHFNTDQFVIYNAAVGGYKQPQQAFKFVYLDLLGFTPDLVINLDGFNEISETISFNKAQQTPAIFPYIYPTNLKLSTDDRSCISLNNTLSKINTNVPLFELASWAYILNCNSKIVAEPFKKPWWHAIIKNNYLTSEDYALASVKIWEASSNFLYINLKARNIYYIHVLQPNQYVTDSKIYSKLELEKSLDSEIYGSPIKKYYHLLNSKNLKTKNFIDERMLFKNLSETIYMDNCCHMNNLGMYLLTKDIINKNQLTFKKLLDKNKI